ncbi:MAG: hypothetical protein ABII12_01160 [Planctomycetota bacterium]
MLDHMAARDRAIRRAIETGHMPNIDLIHQSQKREGFQPCFGRSEEACHSTHCKWHGDCAALAAFRPTRALGLAAKRSPSHANLGRPSFKEYRDGRHDTARNGSAADAAAALVDALPNLQT